MGSLVVPNFDDIVAALDEERITILYPIAAFAWGWYDYIITLGDEVELVWTKQFRGSSWLFLWIRYYGLVSITFHIVAYLKNVRLSQDEPVVLHPRNMPLLAAAELVSFVTVWSVEIVLQLRLYAMYMSKCIALFNAALYVAGIPTMIYLWLRQHPFRCDTTVTPNSPFVEALRCGRGYQWYIVPVIGFDIWVGGLACYKFLERVRRRGGIRSGTLYDQLLQTSVIHFFGYVSFILLFHAVSSFGHSDRHVSLFHTANYIVTCRLMLQLRHSYYGTSYDSEADSEATLSVVRFRPRSKLTLVDPTFWGCDSDHE